MGVVVLVNVADVEVLAAKVEGLGGGLLVEEVAVVSKYLGRRVPSGEQALAEGGLVSQFVLRVGGAYF